MKYVQHHSHLIQLSDHHQAAGSQLPHLPLRRQQRCQLTGCETSSDRGESVTDDVRGVKQKRRQRPEQPVPQTTPENIIDEDELFGQMFYVSAEVLQLWLLKN